MKRNRLVIAFLAVVFAWGQGRLPAEVEPGVLWKIREFDASRMSLNAVSSYQEISSTTYFAVGDNGAGRVSTDSGASWSSWPTGSRYDLRDVVFVGPSWLAVGGVFGGPGVVVSGTDFTLIGGEPSDGWGAWLGGMSRLECIGPSLAGLRVMGLQGSYAALSGSSGFSCALKGTHSTTKLAWTGARMIAVSTDGVIRDSTDGNVWTTRWSDPSVELEALATKGIVAVASGLDIDNSHLPLVVWTNDGVTWSPVAIPPSPATRIRDIVRTSDRFVAGCDDGRIFTSVDGDAWGDMHQISTVRNIHALHWNGYSLVAVGSSGFIASTSEAAPDEVSDWTIDDLGTLPRAFHGMARTDVSGTDRLVLVGSLGKIMTSDDEGEHRVERSSGTSSSLRCVTATTLPTRRFLAAGSSGKILSSLDGITWNTETSGTTNLLEGMAWEIPLSVLDDPFAIVVGDNGTILTSENGSTWTARTSGTTERLMAVASGAIVSGKPPVSSRRIVAVGGNGTILTSSSGTVWTPRTSGTTRELRGVTAIDSGFVAVGDFGTILRSTDGTTWSSQPPEVNNDLEAVTWTGDQVLAVGGQGIIHTSPDGTTWTRRYPMFNETLNAAIALPSGRLCAVGYQEAFLVSDAEPDFGDWIAGESPPPGEDGTRDDPNGDGVGNLTAYAHFFPAVGTPDPGAFGRLPRWQEEGSGGRRRFQVIAPFRADLRLCVENSAALQSSSWGELLELSRSRPISPETVNLNVYSNIEPGFFTIDFPDGFLHPGQDHLRLHINHEEPLSRNRPRECAPES